MVFAVVAVCAGILCLSFQAASADARVDGWRAATKKEKRQLKKKAKRGRGNAKVTGQYRWSVTKRSSPRYAIVCGKTHGRPIYGNNIGGAIFKRVSGRWKYDKAGTSGELQIIFAVCS